MQSDLSTTEEVMVLHAMRESSNDTCTSPKLIDLTTAEL